MSPMTKQLNSVTRRVGPGARQDPARRQEPEVLQRLVERLLPLARLGLHGSQSMGYAAASCPRW